MATENYLTHGQWELRKYEFTGRLSSPEWSGRHVWQMCFNGRLMGSIEQTSKFGFLITWIHKGKSWPVGIKRRSLRSAFSAARSVYNPQLPIGGGTAPIGFIAGDDWR